MYTQTVDEANRLTVCSPLREGSMIVCLTQSRPLDNPSPTTRMKPAVLVRVAFTEMRFELESPMSGVLPLYSRPR